jgi:pilus assembly protein CpaE
VLHNSDEVVITATPDLAGLRNTKQLVDWLKASRPNDLPPRVVLNQTGIPKRSEISVQEFTRVCGIESPVVVGFDGPLFMNATNNGQMLSQISPNAKAVETIGELATVVSGRKIPAKRSFFSLKLFGSGKLKRKGA